MLPPSTQPLAEQLKELPTFHLHVEARTLHFRQPATTSRGALTQRTAYYIHAQSETHEGTGECSLMPGLSRESPTTIRTLLHEACRQVETWQTLPPHFMADAPALRFGLESALLCLKAGSAAVWDTPFTRGEKGLAIHHLIWMSDTHTMKHHFYQGGKSGATCLKSKVGALPFAEELALLRDVHAHFPDVELRVDANGAFTPREALIKLDALANAGVTSIEQPIRPGQWKEMAELIRHSPLPIALDEELIPPTSHTERAHLLDALNPAAIVIKPSLHGGLLAAEEWVTLAEQRNIRWWCNSALESHVGHAMLAQWCALRAPGTLHGLGTGQLFADDLNSNIHLKSHHLYWQSP